MEVLKSIFSLAILMGISNCHSIKPQLYEDKGISSRFDVPVNFGANSFVFPAKDTNKERENTSNRTAIDDKRLCKPNELLYPGDQEGDWICDCKPGFLYDPQTSACYEAYSKGPCGSSEILVLNKSIQSSPLCMPNPCSPGSVVFKEKCQKLYSTEACSEYKKLIGRDVYLVPDPTTLALTCADNEFEFDCVDRCCSGSKRDWRVREVCARSHESRN